jgi:NADH dehydrogenase/NADH:ubiquinone oxidoreductase subunit G
MDFPEKGTPMSENVSLTIDEKMVSVPPGTTILKAAENIGIEIPTICYHDYCTANGLCRICVVEVEGARALIPSCIAEVREGLVVHTQTEHVQRSRRVILEMLASTLDLSEAPEILEYIQKYQVNVDRYPNAIPRQPEVVDDNSIYIRDYAKCILCWRCVQVCADDAQYTYAINFSKRGFETQISTSYQKPMPETTCVFCGQCIGVCPTGALKSKKEWLLQKEMNPDEIMVLTRKERKQKTYVVTTEESILSGDKR